MAGERTPDQSGGVTHSGTSTDNDISLREHMQRQMDQAAANARQEHHRVQELFHQRLADLSRQLDERWVNQQASVEAALSAQEKAVAKAETASEKRFDSVNEFRGQLADQAARFMPRTESVQRHDSVSDRITELEKRVMQQLAQINSRLDLSAGSDTGVDKAWGYLVAAIGLGGGVIGIVIGIR